MRKYYRSYYRRKINAFITSQSVVMLPACLFFLFGPYRLPNTGQVVTTIIVAILSAIGIYHTFKEAQLQKEWASANRYKVDEINLKRPLTWMEQLREEKENRSVWAVDWSKFWGSVAFALLFIFIRGKTKGH